MAAQLDNRAGAVAHVRFAGRSFDIPLSTLDLGPMSADGQIRRSLARYLSVPEFKLDAYVIDRHANGNLTVRPEAVFGTASRGNSCRNVLCGRRSGRQR